MDYQINPNQNFRNQTAGGSPPGNLPVEPESVSPPPPPPPPPRQNPPIPPQPSYAPPVPNFPQEPEERKRPSVFSIIVAVLAIIIIFGLAAALYYFAVTDFQMPFIKQVPSGNTAGSMNVEVQQPTAPEIPEVTATPTEVIRFVSPDVLPVQQKSGNCWVNSIAQPYRKDAWRCMVGTIIYDPCFETQQAGIVYCPMDLLAGAGDTVLIKLLKPLPSAIPPKTVKDNWAWLVELEDGVFVSPYTGTKPFVDGAFATYGSKIINGERVVLMGDLVEGEIWTAQKKILIKNGTSWITKSTETIKLETVWQ